MSAEELKKEHCEGNTLNLEKCVLEDHHGQFLAALIETNDPAIKRITTIKTHFTEETITLILNALKKNNYITQFTFSYKNKDKQPSEHEIAIKQQLERNEALQQLINGSSTLLTKVSLLIQIIPKFSEKISLRAIVSAAASILIFQGFKQLMENYYYIPHYRKAKQDPLFESTPSYIRGKHYADGSYWQWVDPRAWCEAETCFAYQMEKNRQKKQFLKEQPLPSDTLDSSKRLWIPW